MMYPVQPMEVRVVHEFERRRTHGLAEHRFTLRLEQERRRAERLAALLLGVAQRIAEVRRLVASGVTWERQAVGNECG